MNSLRLVFLLVFASLAFPAHSQLLKEKVLIGRIEWGSLPDLKVKYKARIDTGAKTTSLHATNVEEQIKDGVTYVKFTIQDSEGKPIELVRKVDTTQRVANANGIIQKRYAIKEKVRMGSIEKEILINLNDRTDMEYKLLIGRNLLLGRFVVDVARSHVLGD